MACDRQTLSKARDRTGSTGWADVVRATSLCVFAICPYSAGADLVLPVVVTNTAIEFEASVQDTLTTPALLPIPSLNWSVTVEQNNFGLPFLPANDIRVTVKHLVPGHIGEPAGTINAIVTLFDVDPGNNTRSGKTLVAHATHFDELDVTYGPFAAGVGRLIIQVDHIAIATFSQEVRSKLFIGAIPLAACDPVGIYGAPPVPADPFDLVARATYISFCIATNLSFGENPPSGVFPSQTPLPAEEARIAAGVTLRWQCKTNRTQPENIGTVASLGQEGGAEPGGFMGVANPTVIRNDILNDGEWGYVASGHPDPGAEIAFQLLKARANPDIWHNVQGTISCGVNAAGFPTTTNTVRFAEATRFPSHRLYHHTAGGGLTRTGPTVVQQWLSNLWSLPAVGTP